MTKELLSRTDPDEWLVRAVAQLHEWGLVLDSDRRLPSWPSLVVERPVRGSWWADPEVHLIHEAGTRFVDHPDVLHVVLVSGKLTCLHRRLWAAFLAVALAVDEWKLLDLSAPARELWRRVQRDHSVFADEPDLPSGNIKANGALMRELESRLLCAGGNVHTARGSHAKFVTTWETWQANRALPAPGVSAADGRAQLDACLERLNREFGGRGTLPWWGWRPTPSL